MLKRLIKAALATRGYEIHHKSEFENLRNSFRGGLLHLVKGGVNPKTVVDAGVAEGTPDLYEIFSGAHHILIEPLDEFREHLTALCSSRNMTLHMAAASSRKGTSVIHVHPDLCGSSLYREDEESNVNGVPRQVPTVTIDDLCREREGPFLLKLDVHGSEIDTLSGATETLRRTECAIVESCLFPAFLGGPQFQDVLAFMRERGFVLYDVLDLSYRPLDDAAFQLDAVFVPRNSPLRSVASYADSKQREEQNQRFIAGHQKAGVATS